MTWEPKNGLHDEDVDVSDEELDGDNSFTKDEKPNALGEQSPCVKCKSLWKQSRRGELLSIARALYLVPVLVSSLLANGIIASPPQPRHQRFSAFTKTQCWRLSGAATINCL